MTNRERVKNFHDTTGAFSWNYKPGWMHPHSCKCNRGEVTPHTHYDEPPHACARCGCAAYDPIVPEFINDNYRALIALETS